MKNAILLFLLIIPVELFCCTFVPDSFCTTIRVYTDNIIVYGSIISKDEDGLDLEVIEILKGEEIKSQIRIWDGKDFDCNGPFDMSADLIGEVNDTIVISLPRINQIKNPWDVIGDYTRPNPYGDTPRLSVNEDIVQGFITGSPYGSNFNSQRIEIEKLIEAIKTFGDCTDIEIITSTKNTSVQNKITVQNPVSNTLSIVQAHAANIVAVNIYSLSGKKMVAQRTEDQLQIAIAVEHLQSGLYILQTIKSDNTQETVKIVKQ